MRDPTPTDFPIAPEMLHALGLAVTTWARVESHVIELLAIVMSGDRGALHAVTETISQNTVIGWIRTLVRYRNAPEEIATRITGLLDEVDRLRRDRNLFVHGVWRVGASEAGTVMIDSIRLGHAEPITAHCVALDDLSEFIRDALAVEQSLMQVLHRLVVCAPER